MNIILRIIIIILQVIIGQLLGFMPAYALGVGGGWELVVIALGYTVGVGGVGVLADILRKRFAVDQVAVNLLGTLIGSFLGVLLILITPAFGFMQLLMPLTGALLGYYLASYLYAFDSAS